MTTSATRFGTSQTTANSWEFGSSTATATSPSMSARSPNTSNTSSFYSYLHSIMSPLAADGDQSTFASTTTFQPRTTLPTHLPLNITPNTSATTTATTTHSSSEVPSSSYTRTYSQPRPPSQPPHAHAPPQLQHSIPTTATTTKRSTYPVNAQNAATIANVTRQLQAVLSNSGRIGVSSANGVRPATSASATNNKGSNVSSSYGIYGRLKACTSCRAAHVACDSGHPACGRCISLGNATSCVYLPARKRGRPKKSKGKKNGGCGSSGKSKKRSSTNGKDRGSTAKKSRTEDGHAYAISETDERTENENENENDEEEEDDEEQNGDEGDDENERERGYSSGQTMLNQREVVHVLNAASRQRFMQEQLNGMGMASTSIYPSSTRGVTSSGSNDVGLDAGCASGSFSSETEDFSPLAIQQPTVSPLFPSTLPNSRDFRMLAPRGNPPTLSYDNAGRLTSAPVGSFATNTSGFPFSHAIVPSPTSSNSQCASHKDHGLQQRTESTLERLESLVSSLLKEVIDLKQEQRVLREEVSLLRSSPQPMLRTTAVTSSEDDDMGGGGLADSNGAARDHSPPTPLDLSCDCYFEPDGTSNDAAASSENALLLTRQPTFPKPAEVIKLSKIDKERVVRYLPKEFADILLGKVTFHDLPNLYPKIPPHNPEDHSFVITDVRKPFMMVERSVSPLPLNNTEAEFKFYWEKYMMPPGYDLIITSLNQACCKLLKYNYDEIVGTSALSLLACANETIDSCDPLWFAGCPYPSSNPMPLQPTRISTRDGEILEIRGRYQMFYDEDGDAAWFVLCLEEVLNRFYPDQLQSSLVDDDEQQQSEADRASQQQQQQPQLQPEEAEVHHDDADEVDDDVDVRASSSMTEHVGERTNTTCASNTADSVLE